MDNADPDDRVTDAPVLNYGTRASTAKPIGAFSPAYFGVGLGASLAWGIVTTVAGHGIAPIGLILFLSGTFAWMQVLAWTGIILLCVSGFLSSIPTRRILACSGLAALWVCWFRWVAVSEMIGVTLVTSLPFIAISLIFAIIMLHPDFNVAAPSNPS